MTTAREVIEKLLEEKWLDLEAAEYAADSILSALDKAGYVVCPKQPTEEMCIAYAQGWFEYWSKKAPGTTFGTWSDWPMEAKEAQRDCLARAMLSAHAKEEANG